MEKHFYDLTNPQKSIWLTEQFYKNTPINNVCGTVRILDKVNYNFLTKSINLFVEKNDSFRIKILDNNGRIQQYVSDYVPVDISTIMLKSIDDLKILENEVISTPFHLIDNLLFKFIIFKFENESGGFIVNTNHLISDAWTAGLVVNEIMDNYEKLITNEPITNEDVPSYVDYIVSENEYLKSDKFKKDKEYWDNVFDTVPEIASIPYSFNSNNINNAKSKRKQFIIDKLLIDKINKFCSERKVSIYNFFIAIYSLYISRITSLNEFVIGTPILNRTTFKEKHTTGMFISTVPLKISLTNNLLFTEFISNISKECLSIFRHQKYPYQYILENLRKKDASIPNLYYILISYQNTRSNKQTAKVNYEASWNPAGYISCGLNIHLYDMNNFGSLHVAYDYQIDKYSEEDISNMHNRIMYMLEQVLNNTNLYTNDIQIITLEEKNTLLNDFNNTYLKYDENKPIIEFFEEQVEKNPNNIAITFENKSLTYKELNEKANSLAYQLRKKNITSNSIVGVMFNRSFEMVISILAVLKAGGAYLPIDPDYPKDRIEYMLEDSKTQILLSSTHLSDKLSLDIETIFVNLSDDKIFNYNKYNLENINNPNDLSYIIYTSGSTGKPKGVMLTQKNLSNFYASMLNYVEYLPHGSQYSIVSITTVSFDIFGFETLISLTNGLRLFMTNNFEQKVTEKLEKYVYDNNIDIIQTTPTVMKFHLDNLSNTKYFSKLKYVILAGEQLPKVLVDRIKKIAPNCTIYNGYGPSETTIFSTMMDVTHLDEITIGKPIANTQVYILDTSMNLVPTNTVGEIYISGDGVGNGYLYKDDLTHERFLKNPFLKNSIMYKTGDLGLWLNNGEIECKGRIDNQVKLRGLRVELEEIEEKINSFVNDHSLKSAVIVKKDTKDILVAFIVSNKTININNLKKYLLNSLPNYMIPSIFVKIDKLLFTPNGKIDRNALQKIDIKNHITTNEIVKPKNEIEENIFNIISSIINDTNFSTEDDFFSIGMDSLNIIRLSNEISKQYNVELGVKDILDCNNIIGLSELISNSITNTNIVKKADIREYYPLSSAQKRVYYTCNMANDMPTLYNMPGAIILDKAPDVKKLENCFKILIKRHSSLRTFFEIVNGNIVQKINNNIDFNLKVSNGKYDNIDKIMKEFIKPFDLSNAPLFRTELVKLDNNKTLLLFDIHHIICDGTSLSILIDELSKLYNSISLDNINIDYKDFTLWEKEQLDNNNFKESKEFWLNMFNDEIPVLNLSYDYPRPANLSFKGAKYKTCLDENISKQIYKLAKELNTTPFVVLICIYYIILSKYSRQNDIVVGTPIIARNKQEFNNIVGMFVNTLALRNNIDNNLNFKDFLYIIKNNVIKAMQYQNYPFNELVNNLNIKRDTSRNPLFDVMFIYQNNGDASIDFDGKKYNYFTPDINISKFDLSLEITPQENLFNLVFEYSTSLFSDGYIQRFCNHYITILNNILQNPDIKISDISMLSVQEEKQILNDFNSTKTQYPQKPVHIIFEEQVNKTPNNIAVVFENKKLTYKELNEKSNQLAYFLRKNGIGKEDIVCILLDKSLEMIIAILAILKAGGAFLPIDVYYPKDRIDYMINDSNSKLILTDKKHISKSNSNIPTICIDLENTNIYDSKYSENLSNINDYHDLAYIMYTSGSTGNAKGVMIEQQSIVRLVKNTNYIQFKEHERILQTGSIVFDACTFEIWGALLNGFELYIIKKEDLLDSSHLQDYLIKNKITILWLTHPLFIQLCEENPHMFSTVRVVLTGGDVLSPKHINMVKNATPNLTIINGYGPTENTTFSTCFTINKIYENSIPIGYPISNSTCYIVSDEQKLLPIDCPGELLVGGDGIGRGYLNNEELTRKKFIKNIFGEGILYKTGDLAKWLPDGSIEFLGRIDSQVKIRGFRVELNEINLKIATYPRIKECTTTVNTINNEKVICSYLVSNNKIDIASLKNYLKKYLPNYMIPTYFMQLDKLPINTNGKIDKNALPTNFSIKKANAQIVKPTNKNEELLLNIFKKVLNTDDIGITDDFFEIGGDSLTAMKVQVEAISNNLNISYGDIFKNSTVKTLAQCLNNKTVEHSNTKVDFSKYDKLLAKNTISNNVPLEYTSAGNVLLTGFTGFLGAHILDSFLKKEKGRIYCLIRDKNDMPAEQRLKNVLNFYFENKYDKYIGNRIILIKGDITLDNLGLDNIQYNDLGNNIDTVIHSAALVKHFGTFKEFQDININGTQKIVDFCKQFNKKLLHISTISVSGNALAEQSNVKNDFSEDKIFDETNFYIGQNIENFYIKSKFEAEHIVLDAILDGLPAYVIRMGNLTSRFTEGKFQQNHYENAFVNRIRSILQIGYAPDYLLNSYVEFTPIDYCGDAIIDLASHFNKEYSVFHLLNEKHVTMKRLYNTFKELGINIHAVSSDQFIEIINNLLKDDSKKSYLEGIINDLDENKKLVYESNVKIESEFSKNILKKLGFEWPYIDKTYIKNYLKYLTDIGYFNLKI